VRKGGTPLTFTFSTIRGGEGKIGSRNQQKPLRKGKGGIGLHSNSPFAILRKKGKRGGKEKGRQGRSLKGKRRGEGTLTQYS